MKPLVAQPAGGPAVPGIIDHESFVAVGGNSGLTTYLFNGPDTVQRAGARRPQLDFVNKPEQFHAFTIVSFNGFFYF